MMGHDIQMEYARNENPRNLIMLLLIHDDRSHAGVQDKVQMHLDRMYLLLQRLRRNRNFSRPAFAGLKAASRGFIEARHPCTASLARKQSVAVGIS